MQITSSHFYISFFYIHNHQLSLTRNPNPNSIKLLQTTCIPLNCTLLANTRIHIYTRRISITTPSRLSLSRRISLKIGRKIMRRTGG